MKHDNWYIKTVLSEPASKANSRRLVKNRGNPRFIKSKKALSYEENFTMQTRRARPEQMFQGDVVLGVRVWYRTRRPDLDISLIKDLLQDRAYANDRQVKAELSFHALDKKRPRSLIVVAPIEDTRRVFDYFMAQDPDA